MRRYTTTPVIRGGRSKGSSETVQIIRQAIRDGDIRFTERVMQETQRLDVLAGIVYEDSTLWWILAAASNIGWGLQVPPGTLIRVPILEDVSRLIE